MAFDNTPPDAKTVPTAGADVPVGFGAADEFDGGTLWQYHDDGTTDTYTIDDSLAVAAGIITVTLSADLSPFHVSTDIYEIEDSQGGYRYACTMDDEGTEGAPFTFDLTNFKMGASANVISFATFDNTAPATKTV